VTGRVNAAVKPEAVAIGSPLGIISIGLCPMGCVSIGGGAEGVVSLASLHGRDQRPVSLQWRVIAGVQCDGWCGGTHGGMDRSTAWW